MKEFMLGNEAVARGLYEAGVRFVSSYPGTPSTEITEVAADLAVKNTYAEGDYLYAEWAPNEKVALESALGAAVAGARSFAAMKHVGLNVAADPLFVSAYTGINAGLVIAVADDPSMHSSQDEQDSRHYAVAAKLPMLEPADSAECLRYTKLAYEISEKFDTPVLLRLSTRVSHSRAAVVLSDRTDAGLRDYVKDPRKYVMMPANAKARHTVVEAHLENLREYAETSGVNEVTDNGGSLGIITAGVASTYAREVFGKNASYLKLGMVNPLPEKLISSFAAKYERVIVIEDLDPVIESFCKSLGLKVDGKNLLPVEGEFSQQLLRQKLLGETPETVKLEDAIPVRPPVLCPGCPHRGVFYTLSKLKLNVSGDIGCYTLGAVAPLSSIDTTFCMGASISALHGINKVRPDEASHRVAVIGDSTFMHSGITGLVNVIYNGSNTTTLILDNSITGMTGHQQNPLTGLTLLNTPSPKINAEDICAAVGVEHAHIRVVDPGDLAALESVIKEELAANCASVVICRKPCALLKYVKKNPPVSVDAAKCKSCRSCMKIGCPCISMVKNAEGKAYAKIDESMCVGCGLCEQLCRFGAISQSEVL